MIHRCLERAWALQAAGAAGDIALQHSGHGRDDMGKELRDQWSMKLVLMDKF
jgi:hypothetical protein